MSFATTPTQQQPINNFGTAVVSGTLAATANGSLIVVVILNQLASGNANSVTDNVGNTYTLRVGSAGTSQRHLEIWDCLSAAAGVTAVTVNNAVGTNVAGSVTEWAGGALAAGTPASLNNTSSASPAAATVTPAVGALVIGGLAYLAAVASTRQDTLSDATYTSLTSVTRGTTTMFAGAYKIASSTAATGPSWTMSPGVSTGEATALYTPKGGVTVVAVAAVIATDAPIPAVTSTVTISGGAPGVIAIAAAAPQVSGGANLLGVTATTSSAMPTPAVIGGAVTTAVKATASATAIVPLTSSGVGIASVVASATATAITPVSQAGAIALAIRAQAASSAPTPTIQSGLTVLVPVAASIGQAGVAIILGGVAATIAASTGAISLAAPSPVVTKSLDVLILALAGRSASASPSPSIASGSSTVASIAQASCAAQPSLIAGGALVTAVATRAVLTGREARVVVQGVVQVEGPARAIALAPRRIRPYGFKVRHWHDVLNGPLIPPAEFE